MFTDPELVKKRCHVCQGRILRRTLLDGRATKQVETHPVGVVTLYVCHKCNAAFGAASAKPGT